MNRNVRVDTMLNKHIWSQGVRNIPKRIRVRLERRRDEDEEAKEKVLIPAIRKSLIQFNTIYTALHFGQVRAGFWFPRTWDYQRFCINLLINGLFPLSYQKCSFWFLSLFILWFSWFVRCLCLVEVPMTDGLTFRQHCFCGAILKQTEIGAVDLPKLPYTSCQCYCQYLVSTTQLKRCRSACNVHNSCRRVISLRIYTIYTYIANAIIYIGRQNLAACSFTYD